MAYVGFGLTGLLGPRSVVPRHALVVVSGYVISQLVFYQAYFWLGGTPQAMVAVFAMATVFNAVYIWRSRRNLRFQVPSITQHWRTSLASLLAAVALLALAGGAYFQAGWGNYWHNGSEDMVDALYGRDAYLNNLLLSERPLNAQTYLRDAELLAQYGPEYFRGEYAEGAQRLGYSSVAFWSILLAEPAGTDAFLVQALLNLLLMAQGVYWLAILALRSTAGRAVALAVLAVGNNFYLATFFASHEGSLMYGAVAPFLLLVGLAWADGSLRTRDRCWLLVLLWLAFLVITYAFPLPFLLAPLAIYALHRRVWQPRGLYPHAIRTLSGGADLRQRRSLFRIGLLVIAVLVLLSGGVALAWLVAEPYRFRAVNQYRSWGYIQSWVAPFIFWGVWQSPNLGNSIASLVTDGRAVLSASVATICLTAGTVWAFFGPLRIRSAFWPVFLVIWLALVLVMKYIVTDPYYLYKVLYTHQFVLIIGLGACLYEWWARSRIRFLRIVLPASVLAVIVANVQANLASLQQLAARPYNVQPAAYQQVAAAPADLLARTMVDIPRFDSVGIVHEILSTAGLPFKSDFLTSDYVLEMKGAPRVETLALPEPPAVWESDIFVMRPMPERNRIHTYVPFQEPEVGAAGDSAYVDAPFVWQGDHLADAFTVALARLDGTLRYVRFCAQPGPSLDGKPFVLHAYRRDGQEFAQFLINGLTCNWVDSDILGTGLDRSFILKSNLKGNSLLPLDDRILNYRVSRVGLTAAPDDPIALRALNNSTDIISAEVSGTLHGGGSPRPGDVLLGNGWYPVEQAGGEVFRWVDNDAEIVVEGGMGPMQVTIDVEPASGVPLPVRLEVLDDTGSRVADYSISGRSKLTVPVEGTPQTRNLRLHAEATGVRSPGDQRSMTFRAFRVQRVDYDASWLERLNEPIDIVPPEPLQHLQLTQQLPSDGLFVGSGWYSIESSPNSPFRWMANTTDIVITSPSRKTRTLALDVEPGPGEGGSPVELDVITSMGHIAAERVLSGRERVLVPVALDDRSIQVIRLQVHGGGLATPDDSRRLNMRVFSVNWADD